MFNCSLHGHINMFGIWTVGILILIVLQFEHKALVLLSLKQQPMLVISRFRFYDVCQACTTRNLHNSESSKGQIININLPRAAKIYFISVWRFRCSMEEIRKGKLIIWSRAFATFLQFRKLSRATRKSFADLCMLCRPTCVCCARRPVYVVQADLWGLIRNKQT